ncbi:MAG: hypothetical protein EHM93_14780 [Bacteroidales bacterium]|nr:MAG: hypothetical protein EHM93_14780 [Bacteroidales bacterium]
MKKLFAAVFIITLIMGIFPQCAKIVSPTGGPKDSLAPVLIRSVPAMNAVNFKGEKLTLTFDEYIQLKDIQKKLAISPPMTKKPEFIQRGKSLEIKLKEPLKENTTYTVYFADAITDNNEGNPLKNFVYAFSTGDIIDSLAVSGILINCFTLKPEENIFVMLYDEQNDSLPIKALPRYLTRTDKNGFFIFNNLQANDYKVFALNDNNSNYKFDQVTEDIAFLNDTLKSELLKNPSNLDTSRLAKRVINLYLFKENSRVQALTGFSRDQRRKLSLAFTKKPEGKITLNPLNFKTDSSWFIQEYNPPQDSLIYWITNDRVNALDTLKMEVSYFKTDSLQNLQPKLDTIKWIYSEKEESRRRKGNKEDEKVKKVFLKVNYSVRNEQVVSPTTPIELSFPEPLKSLNDSLLTIYNHIDSSKVNSIKIFKDTLNPRIYRINYPWNSDITYGLKVLPGAFTSLNGLSNDTLKLKFKGANPESFGVLNITLLNFRNAAIIELLSEKRDRVIDRKTAQLGEKVSFTFINPGKYSLRFIEDSNKNGIWDTGWYLKGIQPEKVYYYEEGKYKGILNIRANWESEITFDFVK